MLHRHLAGWHPTPHLRRAACDLVQILPQRLLKFGTKSHRDSLAGFARPLPAVALELEIGGVCRYVRYMGAIVTVLPLVRIIMAEKPFKRPIKAPFVFEMEAARPDVQA